MNINDYMIDYFKGYEIHKEFDSYGKASFKIKGLGRLVFNTNMEARKYIVKKESASHVYLNGLMYKELSSQEYSTNLKSYCSPFKSDMKSRITREKSLNKYLMVII